MKVYPLIAGIHAYLKSY